MLSRISIHNEKQDDMYGQGQCVIIHKGWVILMLLSKNKNQEMHLPCILVFKVTAVLQSWLVSVYTNWDQEV